jgi:hypothetical protein
VTVTDQELRGLVREAVQRHLGAAPARPPAPPAPTPARAAHPSHAIYLTIVNAGESCVIEPAVSCDHCGYCRSHGH